jgi:Family of unknown function (DUF5678)
MFIHGSNPGKPLGKEQTEALSSDDEGPIVNGGKKSTGRTMDKDDLWIVDHFSELVTKYAGKYVAVVNETLVAVGDSGKDVENKAREIEPNKMPSVLRVPREEDMACLL